MLTSQLKINQSDQEEKSMELLIFECEPDPDPDQPQPDSLSVIDNQCIENMKYAYGKSDLNKGNKPLEKTQTTPKEMPECFEKSLIRICYLLYILQNIVSSGAQNEFKGEDILQIKTKVEVFKSLENDQNLLKRQHEEVKIDDPSTNQQMTQSLQSLQGIQLEHKTLEQSQISFLNLLKKVRPFNFQEFFKLVEVCGTNSEKLKDKEIILLLGTTGAGKSTTIQYLFGANMVKNEKGHIQARPMPQSLKTFIASAAMKSQTRYINVLEFEYTNPQGKKRQIVIVDTPGFGDTQSIEVDISNSLGIIRAVGEANCVYPVFMFNQKNMGGRSELMKQLIDFYSCMIKNLEKNLPSINFFFTHFADLDYKMGEHMVDVNKQLNPEELSKKSLRLVLDYMEKLGKEKKLLILDPLNKEKRVQVLEQILSGTPIYKPKREFTLNLLERSKVYLDKQVSLQQKSILEAVSQGQTEQALFKIDEMKQLAKIFEPYDLGFKGIVQQINLQIKEFVEQKIGFVKDRICTCMKPGNQLYEEDIKNFQEALDYEKKISPLLMSGDTKQQDQQRTKIQSDQQSTMITNTVAHCTNILTELDRDYQVNDDEWFHYFKKTVSLSEKIPGFEHLKENAINKFNLKFYNLTNSGKEILKKVSIDDYQPQDIEGGPESSGDEKNVKPKNKQFEEHLIILFTGLTKIKQVTTLDQKFISNLEKYVDEILQKVPKLTNSIGENFKLEKHEDGLPYDVLTEEKLKKIQRSLEMLEKFMNSCKRIDNRFYQEFNQLFEDSVKKCENLFESHQKFFEDMEKQDLDINKSAEVNSRFKQIDLIRRIRQINHKTNEPYHKILSQLKNSVNYSQTEISTIIGELDLFSGQQEANIQGLKQLLKRLKEALTIIRTLGEAATENSEFMKKMFNKIQESFESLVKKLGEEAAEKYQILSAKNYAKIKPLAKIFDLVNNIEDSSAIIKVEVKTELFKDQLRSIKSTFVKIHYDCIEFSSKLMDKTDYISLDNYYKFMIELLCQNKLVSQINKLLEFEQIQQEQQSNLQIRDTEFIEKIIKKQSQLKKSNFEEAVNNLYRDTEIQNQQEAQEEQKEIAIENNDQDANQKIKNSAEIIKNLIKLENFLEKYYKDQVSSDKNLVKKFYLDTYASKLKTKFYGLLDQDMKSKSEKTLKWKQLKLQALQYLKEIDFPRLDVNGQNIFQQKYDQLHDQVHYDPQEFLKKAQKLYLEGDFNSIKETCINQVQDPIHANILKSINNYLSDQARKKFDLIQRQMSYDYSLELEEAKQIGTLCEELNEIDKSLGDNILIQGKSISVQIEGVLQFLAECLLSLQKQVDQCLQQRNFFQCMIEIKKSMDIMATLNKEMGAKVKENPEFKKINEKITLQKSEILEQIKHLFKQFKEDDKLKFTFSFSPKSLCDNISQIQKIPTSQISQTADQIADELKNFRDEIQEKFQNQKKKIIDELQDSKDLDQHFDNENKLQRFNDSLAFLPTDICQLLRDQSSNIIESSRKKIEDKQALLNQKLLDNISTTQYPRIISEYLEENQNLIKNDRNGNLKPKISKLIQDKFEKSYQDGSKKINDNQLAEAIQEQIKDLSDYIELPSVKDYVGSQQKLVFGKLKEQIALKFYKSLEEFQQYFSETHSEKGDRIQNGQYYGDQKDQQAQKIHFQVIDSILSCLKSDKDFVLRHCVTDLEYRLTTFCNNASNYLKKMKIQHQNSIQNKIPQENIAAISNMKYTKQVLTPELKKLFNEIKVLICEKSSSDFHQELQSASLETMEKSTQNWLNELKAITDQPFNDISQDEQARIKLYKEVQFVYELITKAKNTEELSIIKHLGETEIQKIHKEFYSKCKSNIDLVVKEVEKFKKSIDNNQKLDKEEQNQFGALYKSLKTMQQILKFEEQFIKDAINNVESALKSKLQQLYQDARKTFIHGEGEDLQQLKQLSIILCDIQSMNENLVLFEEQINKTMNLILEDYKIATAKNSKALKNLQDVLRGIEGSQGPMLAANHPQFQAINILQLNQQFQSKKIDEVLQLIKGTDLDENDKEDLLSFYEEFLGIYTSILDEMLVVRFDSTGKNKLPMDFSGIIGNIKNIFSSDMGKKWTNKDIEEAVEWRQNGERKQKSALLLAHIFALWSLMNAEHYKKQQEQDPSQTNLKGYLLQPHVAQILSILRLIGVGYSNNYCGGSEFNRDWANVFGNGQSDSSQIRNNFVQIKTGEGKSVVLAVVSIIFALNGFEVNCACYSKYLSTRDRESFDSLFKALGLQMVITYGTFNEIAEKKLNQDGEIREIIQALVLKEEFCKNKPVLKLNRERRPQVLLIDEVDVFFSKSFYGRNYIPQAQIEHENISALTDYIWNRQLKMIEEQQVKLDQDQKQKVHYLSLKQLKETSEYKNAINLFKPEFQFLVEEAVKKMIIDIVQYQSVDHQYVIHEGEIGYENQDQISTNATIGYQTLFAYYDENRKGTIKDDVFNKKKAIGIKCSSFSYAEVPLQYNIILGVTGTLETLSEPQKNIINDVYKIHHQTLSPSVHSSDDSQIFHPVQNVTIVRNSSEYYMKLINEMGIYLNSGRPVILFFEHNKSLQQFLKSENFKDKQFSYQILNELDSDAEKKNKVLKATQGKAITLSTKNFGRGTDFCCYDQKVIEAGGLVVIQTFLSEDLSEETQIKGRTGRQGTKGKYIMFLNLADLSKFNIELVDIENSPHYYNTLCEFRDRKLANENQETTKNRDTLKIEHDLSIEIMDHAKKIVNQDPGQCIDKEQQADEEAKQEEFKMGENQQIDLEKLKEYLLAMNKGITLETNDHFMKVLVLMDMTGSMGVTLQKTKNCVSAMFVEARNALREMNLCEDLMLMKIAGYRNYNSLEENILQVSPEWTSDPSSLTKYLNNFQIQGGWGNEAMEIGFQYANKEIENNQGIPLSMVIVIGDAPPNTLLEVEQKRAKNKKYWEQTQNYRVSTFWEHELRKIKEEKVPVHAFYVLNEKNLKSTKAEMEKEKAHLKTEFSKLTVNEGKCSFLDIHNEEAGQRQLKDFFKYLIVYRATEINRGVEEAMKSVSKMEVSFT